MWCGFERVGTDGHGMVHWGPALTLVSTSLCVKWAHTLVCSSLFLFLSFFFLCVCGPAALRREESNLPKAAATHTLPLTAW